MYWFLGSTVVFTALLAWEMTKSWPAPDGYGPMSETSGFVFFFGAIGSFSAFLISCLFRFV